MITLTPGAQREVKTIVDQQSEGANGSDKESKTFYLRVGVKGGGCSGFSYTLDLTEEVRDNDERWEQDGIEVICDPKSALYLNGTTIDFKDEMMGRGFVFNNPNASSTCGCGSSFSA